MSESSAIRIGTNTFFVGFTDADNERRQAYFLNGEGEITKDEQDVLDTLGIDAVMENILRLDLPEFFQKLGVCNSDASIVLKKECEIPYYVIWTTLLKNRHETKRRLSEREDATHSLDDLGVAMTDQLIDDIRPEPTDESIQQLFTLIVNPNATPLLPADDTIPDDIPSVNTLFRIIPIPNV